jgi:hypothetical protein
VRTNRAGGSVTRSGRAPSAWIYDRLRAGATGAKGVGMNKSNKKKLMLNVETCRQLSTAELTTLRGGMRFLTINPVCPTRYSDCKISENIICDLK